MSGERARRCALVAILTTEGSARFAASLKLLPAIGDPARTTGVAEAVAGVLATGAGAAGATQVVRASHSGRSVLTVNRIATQIVQTCAKTSHNRFSIVVEPVVSSPWMCGRRWRWSG